MPGTIDDTQEVTGPLAALDGPNAYNFTGLTYPLDLGTNPQRGHSIIFYIDAQNGSSYLANGYETPVVDASGNKITSQTAQNLSNDTTQQQGLANLLQNPGTSAPNLGIAGGTTRISQAIALYMPDTVNFIYEQSYDSPSMTDEFGDVGLAASIIGSPDIQKLSGMNIGKQASALFKAGELQIGEAALKALGQLNDTQIGLAGAAIGVAINPQLQVIFKGTSLRNFQYEFRFAPTSAQEAQAVQNIIQQFRFHQAPEIAITGQGRYFVPPSQFDIQMLFNGQINPNLPKIATCILNNVNIDYGASSNWATFTDGQPIDIRMNLQFMEIEIITKGRVAQGY